MPALDEIMARWEQRRQDAQRFGSLVRLDAVADEVISTLRELKSADETEALTLSEAALQCGYHPDSIARLIRKGRLTNVGAAHHPRVLQCELAKVVGRRRKQSDVNLVRGRTTAKSSNAGEIARDAIAGRLGRPHSA